MGEMFAMARGILLQSGHELAGVRRACSAAMALLAVQVCAGMIVNLYVQVPAGDAHASYLQEIKTAPGALTVHALIGLALLAAGTVLAIRAIASRRPAIIMLATAGLGAVAGAFAAGEVFVRNGADAASLWMALLTGVALLCYVAVQAVAAAASGAPAEAAQGQAVHRTRTG
jgi:hypothetical protein